MSNAILLALVPIFFALDYGAGRGRIVDNHNVDSLNTLVMNFALPASLFAVNYRLDSAAEGSMVTASTVFSIATLAIAIAVLFPA